MHTIAAKDQHEAIAPWLIIQQRPPSLRVVLSVLITATGLEGDALAGVNDKRDAEEKPAG